MVLETIKLPDGNILEIYQDQDVESPFVEMEQLGTVHHWHPRYDLGTRIESPDDIALDNAVYLPVYLMDHSGLSVRTTPFSCPWDSGQVGFIVVSRDKLKEERLDDKTDDEIKEYLKNELKLFDQYLNGNVYGFRLFEVKTCNLGCEHKEEIDSCWSFYGRDFKTNGMFDYIDEDYHEAILKAV